MDEVGMRVIKCCCHMRAMDDVVKCSCYVKAMAEMNRKMGEIRSLKWAEFHLRVCFYLILLFGLFLAAMAFTFVIELLFHHKIVDSPLSFDANVTDICYAVSFGIPALCTFAIAVYANNGLKFFEAKIRSIDTRISLTH